MGRWVKKTFNRGTGTVILLPNLMLSLKNSKEAGEPFLFPVYIKIFFADSLMLEF